MLLRKAKRTDEGISMKRLTSALMLLSSILKAQAPVQTPTATVHVYREKRFVGSAVSPSIYVDGTALQRLHNGSFFVATVPSGKHMITAGRSEVGLFIDFEPGKHYYFRMDHKNWAGTAASGRQPMFLSQVPAEQAEADMRKLKHQ
jgi:hypothetical protein